MRFYSKICMQQSVSCRIRAMLNSSILQQDESNNRLQNDCRLGNSPHQFNQMSEITYNWELLFYLCFLRQPIMRTDGEVKLGSVPFYLSAWFHKLRRSNLPSNYSVLHQLQSLLHKAMDNTISHQFFFTAIRYLSILIKNERVVSDPF